MDALVSTLVFCQALGALIGALCAVWAELAYVRALRDGTIDDAERAHLAIIGNGLRIGMSLLLLSSFGIVIVWYVLGAKLQPASMASYWVLMFFALLIVVYASALARKKVSFEIGSAIIFSAWWFLTYLALGELPGFTFVAAVAAFMVAAAIFYVLLRWFRLLIVRKS
jgi:hypothetical protein